MKRPEAIASGRETAIEPGTENRGRRWHCLISISVRKLSTRRADLRAAYVYPRAILKMCRGQKIKSPVGKWRLCPIIACAIVTMPSYRKSNMLNFRPTLADIGREVIYIPEYEHGILLGVHGTQASFQFCKTKELALVDIRCIRLSLRSLNRKKRDRFKTRSPKKNSTKDSAKNSTIDINSTGEAA
jgi:hypothetical protein